MVTSRTKSTLFACVTMAAYLAAPIQSCPMKCTCEEMQFHRVAVVCEGQGLTSIPFGLPNNTYELNLSHNNFTILDFRMLSDLDRLRNIDLSWNEISMFHGSFNMLKDISTLDLSHNNIEFIPRKAFKDAFQVHKTIHLQGNPLNCDCNQWNSDLCDCSEDIFSCTCTMQWLQEMIERFLWNDEYLNGPNRCQKPTELRDVPIRDVTFMPFECKTKYQKIVGGTLGSVALMLAVVAAYVLYKRTMSCHCYTQRSMYVHKIEDEHELVVCDSRRPTIGRASTNPCQGNSGGELVLVNNRETNPKVTRGSIADNGQPSGSAEGLEHLIKRNYPLLKERLQVSDLFPHLIQRGFLHIVEKEHINSKTTTQGKAEALLDLLSQQGKCTNEEFVEILQEGKHRHIIGRLE